MTKENFDKLELEVGPDKVAVRTAGDNTGRLTGALADALSPFTHSLGALGDVIHYFRQENAIRALQSARRLAAECGVEIKAVPPKFLVQWVEAASLEEEGTDDLSDLFAGLLISASQNNKPTFLAYKRFLSEMTGQHASLLRWISDFDETNGRFDFRNLRTRYTGLNDLLNESSPKTFRGFEIEKVKEVAERVEGPGVKIFQISTHSSGDRLWFPKKQMGIGESTSAAPFAKDLSHVMLKNMGLVEQTDHQINGLFGPQGERGVLVLKLWHLSALGYDFLEAVAPKGALSPPSA